MVYGAKLNARNDQGQLPIDIAANEEIKQAIRDEPQRRWDQQPRKRCFEEERQIDATATTASSNGGKEGEQGNEGSHLNGEVEGEKGMVAEEDEDSEPSDEEDC